MGPGQFVQAPEYFDPVTATDAELACYGFPARPTNPADAIKWAKGLHSLPLPKEWVVGPTGSLPDGNMSRFSASHVDYFSGTVQLSKWGGYEVWPTSQVADSSFWLAQGEWKMPGFDNFDGHTISQWIGLGCCQANTNQLIQGGTYVTNPNGCCGGGTYGFFWEVPHYNCDAAGNCGSSMPMIFFGPSMSPGDTAAFVVEHLGIQEAFEACNETLNQCTWTPWEYYSNLSGYSPMAEFQVEDTGTCGSCTITDDPPYSPVHWGPSQGPNNENIVDDPNNVSWPIGQLINNIKVMGFHNGQNMWPGYMAPTAIDGSTNFSTCLGTYQGTSVYPASPC